MRHVRKYSRATACSGVAGSFYGYDPNKMIGGRKMLSAHGDRKRTSKAIKEIKPCETRTRIGRRGRLPEGTEGEGNEIKIG